MTLGENGWEHFRILIDGDSRRVLHPGFERAPKETAVVGPDEGSEDYWTIDGRCDTYGVPSEVMGGDVVAAEADALTRVTVETADMGKPGDRYRIRLHVHGKWRMVTWHKSEAAPESSETPTDDVRGKYYLKSDWSAWTLAPLPPAADGVPGVYSAEVKLLKPGGKFQVVRNSDPRQLLYPCTWGEDRDTVCGPDEYGEGCYWKLGGSEGDVFKIDFQRHLDTMKVSYTHLRNEALTREESVLASIAKYTISGTWSRHLEPMRYDSASSQWTCPVTTGPAGRESFQILREGNPDMTVHPSTDNAGPRVPHDVRGPHAYGHDLFWTIGADHDDPISPGTRLEVRLWITNGWPTKVEWVRV